MQVIKIAKTILINHSSTYYLVSKSITTPRLVSTFTTKKTLSQKPNQLSNQSSPFSLRTYKTSLNNQSNQQEETYLSFLNDQNSEQKSNQDSKQMNKQQTKYYLQLKNVQTNIKHFVKNAPLAIKTENSQKLMQMISCFISEQQVKDFFKLIRQFEVEAYNFNKEFKQQKKKLKGKGKDIKSCQEKLFSDVCSLLNESLQEQGSINEILRLLSESDPKMLNQEDVAKVYTGINEENFNSFSQKKKLDLVYNNTKQTFSQNKKLLTTEDQTSNKLIKNQFYNIFKQMHHNDKNPQHHLKKKNHQQIPNNSDLAKLYIKKSQETQLQIRENSIAQIEERLFQKKKIVQDNILLSVQESSNLTNQQKQQRNDFGQNWIYAYELPYSLEKSTVQELISHVNKSFGKIQAYVLYPYKNMLQRQAKDITYQIPDNLDFEKRKKERIKTIKVESPEQCITKPKKKGSAKTKILALEILQKIKKQKERKLNRSSIVFKFQSKSDKMKLLNPEYRLFGVNFQGMKNIRFQQAQSKNLVVLSMIPWGCNSSQLVSAINNQLKVLNIKTKDPNCILAKGFIFIEFHNFYQSFHATQLLHKMKFQNTQLKAQISYGSSTMYKKQYGSSMVLDHHENLIKKLKQIQCFYGQIMEKSK